MVESIIAWVVSIVTPLRRIYWIMMQTIHQAAKKMRNRRSDKIETGKLDI